MSHSHATKFNSLKTKIYAAHARCVHCTLLVLIIVFGGGTSCGTEAGTVYVVAAGEAHSAAAAPQGARNAAAAASAHAEGSC